MADPCTFLCQLRCISLGCSRLINRIAGISSAVYPESAMLDEIMEFHDLGPADCAILHSIFLKADKDNSGAIEMDEFFELLGCKRDLFGDYLFQLIDVDNDGALDFEEFVLGVVTYCGFAHEDVLKFIFYIFDPDKNGFIEEDELVWMCKMLRLMNPDIRSMVKMDKILERFDTDKDGRLDFAEFVELDRQFPKLTFPAFKLQNLFMSSTLGVTFFEDRKWYKEEERKKIPKRELARIRAKEKEREKAKRELKKRLTMRKMGVCRYLCCCWLRKEYYKIAIADRDGRPDFEMGNMFARKIRFRSVESTKETASQIFDREMAAAYKGEVQKARRQKQKAAEKYERDKKERQERRSKRNRDRGSRRGYPVMGPRSPKNKFKEEYAYLKSMSGARVAPEEAW